MTEDDRPRVPKWRPELLALDGVDGDPWRALLLSQLIWFRVITKNPDGWIHKTAEEALSDIGAVGTLKPRAIRAKLQQLERAGLLEAVVGWQRRKQYRPNLSDKTIAAAYESARGASSIVLSNEQVAQSAQRRRHSRHESADERHESADLRHESADASTESTTESTTEVKAQRARTPAAAVEQHDEDAIDLLREFHDLGRMDATIAQCDTIVKRAREASLDQRWLINELLTIKSRAHHAPAYSLTKMLLQNIADVVPPAPLVADSIPPEDYEPDERTDDDVALEAGESMIAAWVAYFRAANPDPRFAMMMDGFKYETDESDVETWLRASAIQSLRFELVAPPETT